ncbi:MAG: TrmH family RNA methyltransferase [Bacteroidetes bacterium]|nr:TrmH family RNA methyltransferase [Bacteroidota bacterium]
MRKLANSELNRLSLEDYRNASKMPVIIILDNVRSLNNIGSVFRSADAFRVEAIYLCGITARPPHREISKTALGATESVKWKYFEETIQAVNELQKNGYRIVAIEQADDSIMLDKWNPDPEENIAVVFGHEVNGVQDNVVEGADLCVEIPQFGTKHSINIAVSAGMVIWQLFLAYRDFLYEK